MFLTGTDPPGKVYAPPYHGSSAHVPCGCGKHSIGRRLNWAPPDWTPIQYNVDITKTT